MHIGKGSSANSADLAKSEAQDAVPARPTGHEAGAATVQTGSKDLVILGEGIDLLQRAFEVSSASREGRVAELRAQFEENSYHVDAHHVSQAIVQDMLELGVPGASSR